MRLAVELRATATAAQEARRRIRELMVGRVSTATLDDLLTVVTELITNAVRHGRGGSVRLEVSATGDTIEGAVENDGRGAVGQRAFDPAGGGMGLHIVEAIARRWRVTTDGITRVSFELSAT